jgi:hypothetical protein
MDAREAEMILLLRGRAAQQQARQRPRQEPDIDFSNLNNLMAP